AGFPSNAVAYCLREAGITAGALNLVGFYEKPLVKFERLLETYVACAPRGLKSYLMALPLWLTDKLWMADDIRDHLEGYEGEVLFGEHHESHAASAFYPSPFEQAAVITIDGVGEWATSSIGLGRGHDLELVKELRFPHSLGLLYSAFTYFTGFKVNSGEYKIMGLAPYGEPKYVKAIKDHLLEIGDDGSLWMNMDYFTYPQGLTMTGAGFERLFDGPARSPESRLTQREMDLARSVQEITEEVMLKMARYAHRETGLRDLCLAGGVALNCVGNGRLMREQIFDQIWIQPAAGDAGGALGVALGLWHRYLDNPRLSPETAGTWERPSTTSGKASPPRYADGMNGSYLGPRASDEDVRLFLNTHGYQAHRLEGPALADRVAALMAQEKVVGLVQGRMEFGPRALGGRSIIGDARSPRMQSVMNLKIKFRESFRPFAPAVLREHVADWFNFDGDSPYMLLVADVLPSRRLPMRDDAKALWGIERLNVPRSTIPAITHVDYSARIQTVRRETSPVYYDIIEAFYRKTGCPVIVNTSFNVRGEPIVCTPEDAYRCFMRTQMDVLVLENYVLLKEEQPAVADDGAWQKEFVLD
ncbi:MAG TPA: carbamoyltransferase N-terminal domain-containing protein, partial [Vicinamibacterales bacterium]|nr:carbamoyltransferase N-terminal domain-containing protein [Vicinamibacterales bacterium]